MIGTNCEFRTDDKLKDGWQIMGSRSGRNELRILTRWSKTKTSAKDYVGQVERRKGILSSQWMHSFRMCITWLARCCDHTLQEVDVFYTFVTKLTASPTDSKRVLIVALYGISPRQWSTMRTSAYVFFQGLCASVPRANESERPQHFVKQCRTETTDQTRSSKKCETKNC